MVVNGLSFKSEVKLVMPARTTTFIETNGLMENAALTFQIMVSNSVGVTETSGVNIRKLCFTFSLSCMPS